MNHPKNDRQGAIRRAEGKVRADHQRRPAASSIAPSAGLCFNCIHLRKEGGCRFGMEGKTDCVDRVTEADTERARTTGNPPRGWRCQKCGALTDGDECQYCGW